mmetsp:Transcript_59380/g.112075  ORF Transcript_59380/g.112075 Transcript_59380/m.112075 type:complete len:320 (-) Transcript_59380:126-1085(-)
MSRRRKAVAAPEEPVERSRSRTAVDDGTPGSSTDRARVVNEEDDEDGDWSFTQTQAETCVDDEEAAPKEDPKFNSTIGADEHQALVAKMARYIFLKGCACEPIIKAKLNEEVLGDEYKKMRGVSQQVFAEASAQVKAVFGFKVVKAPLQHFPQTKFKDAFYVINDLASSKLRGDVLQESQPALRALLMTILALCYSSNHGTMSHKLGELQLIAHLEKLDPDSTRASRELDFGHEEWKDVIELFVKQHYLLRVKEEEPADGAEERANVVGLGPRAFLEVGRRQVLFFTHEAVGMAVDQSLLDELDDDKGEEGSQDAEVQA